MHALTPIFGWLAVLAALGAVGWFVAFMADDTSLDSAADKAMVAAVCLVVTLIFGALWGAGHLF